jgi:serine/threonine protein kinase/Tfp pilus assembly protein PilF
MIKPELSSHLGIVKRFKKEIKLASQITHENVCRIYDLGEIEDIKYISMEFIKGTNLQEFIQSSKRLSVETALPIAEQICQALIAAHKKGVIHRDLKPQNIMLDKKGNAYVMDFGIARSLEAEEVTKPGAIIGTPAYISPEQAEGKAADTRSDIYSLGCILYEMLTGKPPFEAETSVALLHKHLKEKPQPPAKLNSQISPSLDKIILKCLEKEPTKRYQGAPEIIEDLKETVIEAEPIAKPVKLPRKLIIAFSAIFVVLIGLVIFLVIRKMKPESPLVVEPGKKSIAVMYFKNNTGDESLDHWRSALSDLLITDLTQSKYLKVLSAEKLFNILGQMKLLEAESYSSEDLKKIASQGKVEHILLGNYAKAGDTIRINIVLQDANTGDTIGSERIEGKGEENIFMMVDELTRRIKTNFEFSQEQIASDIDREVSKITTSSPEAYRYYSEGVKYLNQGDYRKSIQFMERAVAIDPEFAAAYGRMAAAFNNLSYAAESERCLQKAFKLSDDRLSDWERYMIKAYYYARSEKMYGKAIEAYKKVLQLYPSDTIGSNMLGWLYVELEQWHKAIERFEVNVKNNVEPPFSYVGLAGCYSALGLYDKSKEILEYYSNNFKDIAGIRHSLAYNYLYQGKFNLALSENDKAFSLNPTHYFNFVVEGDIYHCKGDLAEAEKEYQKLLNEEEQSAHLFGRQGLGALYLLQGRFEKSESQFKKGFEQAQKMGEKNWELNFLQLLSYMHVKSGNIEEALEECNRELKTAVEEKELEMQIDAIHFKGIIYLEMNAMDEAQKTARELKQVIENGLNKKAMRYYYYLMGQIEFERNNYSKAIEYFTTAISLLSYQRLPLESYNDHALFIESLASTYYQSGDLDKAREGYEKITMLTTGRLFYGDIYARSFYMLGKIYQQKGWEGKAIENYEKFLHLWKEADSGIPEITDAKKQLEVLKTQ